MSQQKIKLAEVFYTIQGEGPNAGVPAIFIRLSGCNFKPPCSWKVDGKVQYCDTLYAEKGKLISLDALMSRVNSLIPISVKPIIVFTGGEPTLQYEAISEFISKFGGARYHFDIESNGSLPQSMLNDSAKFYEWIYTFSHYIVSPKPQTPTENIVKLASIHTTPVSFKFVYDGTNIDFIRNTLLKMPFLNPDHIYLMSAGCTPEELRERDIETVELCKKFGYRFSPRIQSWLYGKKRGV
jgi:7-carboxy-7-deazaguanine synthase